MKQTNYLNKELSDSFGRAHDYVRISLTEKCNLRCRYCMPEEGAPLRDSSAIMKKDEVIGIASAFVDMGVKKIRLTGGEPLVCRDAAEIIGRLSEFPVKLTITTNAVLVDKFIDVFQKAGITGVNVSLDSLVEEKFDHITRRRDFTRVKKNIELMLNAGFRVKVNAVVMKGFNEDEILDFVEWTRDTDLHVRFIEFMPFNGNHWNNDKVVTHKEILERINNVYPISKLNDGPHSTAMSYKVTGFKGTIAVISTISAPFCDSCNRLRLTADGHLRNCLFAQTETDLLTPFRKGEDIRPLILSTVQAKYETYGGREDFRDASTFVYKGRCMTTIGG